MPLNLPASAALAAEKHCSVMLEACLEALNPREGCQYVDATLGMGGHTDALLRRLAALGGGSVLGGDQDAAARGLASLRVAESAALAGNRFELFAGNYSELPNFWLSTHGETRIDGGLILDLGVSSMQLDEAERGFSFQRNGPLDMRMNPEAAIPTAADLLNTWSEAELAECFFRYGEENYGYPIARAIVQDRTATPWQETLPLAGLIERVYRSQQRKKGRKQEGKHPATRVFQALRIAVNAELSHLEACLGGLPRIMGSGSRLAILTFHSLEDRIIKQQFKLWTTSHTPCAYFPDETPARTAIAKAITKKPLEASAEELDKNPRSRSAKLRVIEFL